jgi:hypothetical protein
MADQRTGSGGIRRLQHLLDVVILLTMGVAMVGWFGVMLGLMTVRRLVAPPAAGAEAPLFDARLGAAD